MVEPDGHFRVITPQRFGPASEERSTRRTGIDKANNVSYDG
jgi:hypothetical protein